MGYKIRNCDCCGKKYKADTRNLNRGWGLTCSKSCAAIMRERTKVETIKSFSNRKNKRILKVTKKMFKVW